MYKKVCDVCGNVIFKGDKFKIKIKREYSNFDIRGWQSIDLCSPCQLKIINIINDKKKVI